MLYEVLRHLRNFFPDSEKAREGTFTIQTGAFTPSLSNIKIGQYYLIEGSVFNDGVFLNVPATILQDETFKGRITPLKIPKELLVLVDEIREYNNNNKPTGYTSESFGGYSYQKATNGKGGLATWKDVFATRLNAWRKV